MPGEFDSVSEKIKEQLGVQNNYSAETKAAFEEAQRMAEVQQKEIKALLKQAEISAKKQSAELLNQNPDQKYLIPRGCGILVPKNYSPTAILDGRDFEAIISSKDVAYDSEDVCLNPITGECTIDNLFRSVYFREKNYFGFILPKNAKGISFILVQQCKVQIQEEAEEDLMRHADEIRRQYKEMEKNIKEIPIPKWSSQI